MLVLAVVAVLAAGALLLWRLGANPWEAYGVLVRGALGKFSGVAYTLSKVTPLLRVGLGICMAFRGGVINTGGAGRIDVGDVEAAAERLGLLTAVAQPNPT